MIRPGGCFGGASIGRKILWALLALGGTLLSGTDAVADNQIFRSPDISPANDMVLFDYCHLKRGCGLAAYVLASGKTFLLEKPEDESWISPAFSPDGQQIAFARAPVSSYSSQIAIMNADGTNIRTLTTGIGRALFPSFSRDGRRLLYMRGLKTPETGGKNSQPTHGP